jgi:hypothetical protein
LFPKKAENLESPHLCTIVEAGLDEIPSILGFDSQIFQVEDLESPNSRTIIDVGLDEIPLTLGVDSPVLRSHAIKVSPFQMIFDINEILIATHFDKGSCTHFPS